MNGPAEPPGGRGNARLEQRVRQLEDQMAALIEAIEVLARGLEDGPLTEPPDGRVAKAARRTHELMLLAKSAPSPEAAGE